MTTLKQETSKIKKLESKGNESASEIANIVLHIAKTKEFKEQYGTSEAYAKAELGWSRSNWNQYVGLGKVQEVLGVPVRMAVSREIKPFVVGKGKDDNFCSQYSALHETESKEENGMLTYAQIESILPEAKKADKSIEEKIQQAYKTVEVIFQKGINEGEIDRATALELNKAHARVLKELFKGQ